MKFKHFALLFLLMVSGSTSLAQSRTLPETHNAPLRYWQAFAEIKDPPPEKATLDLMEKTLAGQASWDEAKLGPVLAVNQNALGIFLRATSLPECDWGLEYRRGPEASIAIVPRASVMARLNSLQAMREWSEGHKDSAVDRWLGGIRFSEDLAHGGSLIFALTAKRTLMINLRALSAELRSGQFSAAEKKRIYASVKALPEDGFDWAGTWGIEEASIEQFLQSLQTSPNPVAFYESITGQPPSGGCMPPSGKEIRALRDIWMLFRRHCASLPPTPSPKSRTSSLYAKNSVLMPRWVSHRRSE